MEKMDWEVERDEAMAAGKGRAARFEKVAELRLAAAKVMVKRDEFEQLLYALSDASPLAGMHIGGVCDTFQALDRMHAIAAGLQHEADEIEAAE